MPEIVIVWTDSPVGRLRVGATEHGLCLVAFADRASGSDLEELANRYECAVVDGLNRHLQRAIDELYGYFAGTLREFTLPLDLRGTEFQLEVWRTLPTISFGQTVSYGELARRIGRSDAPRAVGQANRQNRVAIVVPCHRVVNAAGAPHGFSGGLWRKKYLLEHEASVVGRRNASISYKCRAARARRPLQTVGFSATRPCP